MIKPFDEGHVNWNGEKRREAYRVITGILQNTPISGGRDDLSVRDEGIVNIKKPPRAILIYRMQSTFKPNTEAGGVTMERHMEGLSLEKFEKWFDGFKRRTREALILGALLFLIATLLMIISILIFRDRITVMGITLVFALSGIFCASGAGIIAAGAISNLRSLADLFKPDEPKEKFEIDIDNLELEER
jgi:hypothetical protein